jgi:hypothetical protein
VSYTYRTDKLLDAIGNDQGFVNQRNCPKQWVGFAIELETELQEATFEIERLKKSNLQLREGAEEQKQRIKRLEEAGDRMRLFCADPDDCFAWDKAKEAKL